MSNNSVNTLNKNDNLSDMKKNDWVEKYLPSSWGAYARLARLDRPVGTYFGLMTALMALVQAQHGLPDFWRTIIFLLGAALMRSAGCTINDIWDRDFDKHVERTQSRPLTSGQVTLKNAIYFLIAQLMAAGALLIFINTYSRVLALILLPLVIIYPLGKRFTFWPQMILGISFNWSMLMAWSDTRNEVPFGAVLMYLGVIAWHVSWDTFYAYCDIEFDEKLGLKSTARLFGERGKQWIGGFFTFSVICWLVSGFLLHMSWGYFAMLSIVAISLYSQVTRFDHNNPKLNFQLFRENLFVNMMLLVAITLGVMA